METRQSDLSPLCATINETSKQIVSISNTIITNEIKPKDQRLSEEAIEMAIALAESITVVRERALVALEYVANSICEKNGKPVQVTLEPGKTTQEIIDEVESE